MITNTPGPATGMLIILRNGTVGMVMMNTMSLMMHTYPSIVTMVGVMSAVVSLSWMTLATEFAGVTPARLLAASLLQLMLVVR